jgi:hypothetical protein
LKQLKRFGLSYSLKPGPIRFQRRFVVNAWTISFWTACAVGGLGLLYALHRMALRLEERGHLYYLKKKPAGGASGCFVAFQQVIEPQIQHVIQVKDERRLLEVKGGSGQDDPDDLDEASSKSRGESDEK